MAWSSSRNRPGYSGARLTVLKADSMNGLSLGGAGASKQLGHTVIFTQPLDRFGFHLATAIIDDFGPLVLGQIQDVLI